MLYALFALLLSLPGCPRHLPDGVSRPVGGADLHSFSWSPESGRLSYVEGRFPQRTYLVVAERGGRAVSSTRLKGYTLVGPTALSKDGKTAAVGVGKLGERDSRDEPRERGLLVVEAESGSMKEALDLPAAPLAVAAQSWTDNLVAVWNGGRSLVWRELGGPAAKDLPLAPAAKAVLTPDGLLAAAADKHVTGVDLRGDRQTARWDAQLTVEPLSVRPDGRVLTTRWESESGKFVLEACDLRSRERAVVLESDGEIETALATPKGVFAVAKDHSRKNSSGKGFLAPRVLLVVEPGGARWSTPWTSRPGAFFGWDEAAGRLWFAVTDRDRPAAWAVSTDRTALTAAGPAIDR